MLLQQGVPPAVLWSLRQPGDAGGEEAAEEAVWACLPAATRISWSANPHRMFTNEAQVRLMCRDSAHPSCAPPPPPPFPFFPLMPQAVR